MIGCSLFTLDFCPIYIVLLWSLCEFPQEAVTDHMVLKGCERHPECSLPLQFHPSISGAEGIHLSSLSDQHLLACLILKSWSWLVRAKVLSWPQWDLFPHFLPWVHSRFPIKTEESLTFHLLWHFLAWCTTCPISITRHGSRIPINCF